MSMCPECQKVELVVIGTEKFNTTINKVNNFNFKFYDKYVIFLVGYCSKCHIIVLREPSKVYG